MHLLIPSKLLAQMTSLGVVQNDNTWDEYIFDSVSDTLTHEKVVVGSYENGSLSDFINGTTQMDGYVTLLNASNTIVWTQTIRSSNKDETLAVAFGPDGNIYVTGYYSGTVTFSSSTGGNQVFNNIPVSNSQKTVFVASYTRAGTLRWVVRDGGQNDDAGMGIACTNDGVVVVGSYVNRSAVIQGSAPALRLNNNTSDFFIMKYSFTGSPMWFRTGGGPNSDYSFVLPFSAQKYSVITSNNEIYVAGPATGANVTLSGLGGATSGTSVISTNTGTDDGFVLKLTNSGAVSWFHPIEHGNGNMTTHLAVDCSGLYISGLAFEEIQLPGSLDAIEFDNNQELFLAKLSLNTGFVIWNRIISSSDNNTETVREVYADSRGSVFIIGDSQDALSVDGLNLPNTSSPAAFIIQFTIDGLGMSFLNLDGTNIDQPTAISPESSSEIIVYGNSNSNLDADQSFLNFSDDVFRWNIGYSASNTLNCCALTNNAGVASISPSASLCPGAPFTLSVVGNSAPPVWEQSADGVNFTTTSLIGNNVTTTVTSPGFFRAAVTTPSCGTVYSNVIAYTLSPPPVYTCDTSTRTLEATTCTATVPSFLPSNPVICSSYTFQQSIPAGSELPLGLHTINITDWQNNIVCTFTINVVETTPPTVTCPASLPNLSTPATGPCGAPIPDFRNLLTVADECTTSVSITQLPAPNTIVSNSTIVLFTVTDQGGNTVTCNLPLNVTDLTPPVFTACPGPQSGNFLADCSFILPNYIPLVSATDNCGAVTFTQFPAAGTALTSSTTITIRASDTSGNTALCTFALTLNDNIPPAITSCPLNFVEPLTNDCFILVRDYRNFLSISETCSLPLTVTQIPAPGSLVSESVDITLTVTDNANNSSTCVFPVFGDWSNIPTVLNCPESPSVEFNDLCEATVPDFLSGLQLSPGCFPAANLDQIPAVGTPLSSPTNVVITYLGNTICTFLLSPVDNTAPTFVNCPTAVTGNFASDCWYEVPSYLPLVSVTDACSNTFLFTQDPAEGTLVNEPTTIVIRATDISGNSSECMFELTLTDNTPPVITNCPALVEEPLNSNCLVELEDYRSLVQLSDNCAPTVLITQSPPAGFEANPPILVTLTATDTFSNSTTCQITVDALPQTAPNITNCPEDTSIELSSNCNAILPDYTQGLNFTNWCEATPVIDQFPLAGTVITAPTLVQLRYASELLCSFTVDVSDATPPIISDCPSSLNASLSDDCSYTIPDYSTLLSTVDNCDSELIWAQNPPAGTSVTSSTPIVIAVADNSGNSSQCSFLLNIFDSSPPVISDCPNTVFIETNSECSGALPDFRTNLTIEDNCTPVVLITQSPLPGTSISGPTVVTITAFNANDQFSICSFTAELEDNTAPTLECPVSINLSTDTECSFGIPDFTTLVNFTDNCSSSLTFTQTPSANSIVQGNQIVAIEVTDAANNTSTCSVLIEAEDIIAPVISCPPTQIRNLTNCVYIVEDFSNLIEYADACDNTLNYTQTPVAGTIIQLDQSPFFLEIQVSDDSGNFAECSFQIELNEPSAPSLICTETTTFYVTPNSCEAEASIVEPEVLVNCGSFTLSNNFNSNNSFVITQSPGEYAALYTLVDEFGQTATCTTVWFVIDSISPEVECVDNITVNITDESCSADVNIPAGIYQDNCSIAFSSSSLPAGNTSLSAGIHGVVYVAEDEEGNSASCETIIEVIDLVAPIVTCQDTLVFSTSPEFCGALVPLEAPFIEENCTINTITSNLGWIEGSPNYFDIGYSTFEWSVSDLSGNTTTCLTIVEVVDDVDPILVCESLVELQTTSADCFVETALVLPTATDNCAIETIVNNLTGSAPYTLPVGETVVVFTATDLANNSANCSTTFRVIELENPSIICPPNASVQAMNNSCSADVVIELPIVSDNCSSNFTFVNSKTGSDSFSTTFEVGETTFTITAFDESGNSSSCSTSVTVIDVQNPEIVCPPNINSCLTTLIFDDPEVSDLCSSVSWEQTSGLLEGSEVAPGNYTIEFTASDGANNTASCSFTITVTEPLPLTFNVPTSNVCADASPINLENFITADFPVEPSVNIPDFIFNPSNATSGWNVVSVTGGLEECPSTASDSIFVNPMPLLTITAPEVNCGLVASFTIDNSGGSLVILPSADYTTSFDGGNVYSISASQEGIYTIEAISVSPEICETTASATLELIEAPEIPDAGSDQLIVQSFTTNLNGSCADPDSLYWFSENDLIFDNVNSLTTTVSGLVEGENIIYLINDSGECGEEIDSLVITVDLLVMPNGFSPNGDGVIEFFVIPNTEDAQSSLAIFNRWGKEVWSSQIYLNQWNGVDANGENLPDDTYFFEWVQGSQIRTGFIIIKR